MKSALKIVKRMAQAILILIALLVLVAVLFINTSPQFGGKPSDESKVLINKSPHFIDGVFKNLQTTVQNTGFKLSTIPKIIFDSNKNIPKAQLPVQHLQKSYFETVQEKPRITWFGHSAVFVELNNQRIFIDPMLGKAAAPHPWLGPNRFVEKIPMEIDSLPAIDVVLISHDHYDHLDYSSIKKLKEKVAIFYVPLGVKAHLVEWGVEAEKVKEFDWWESISLNGITYVATPARHFSGRGITNRNTTLWASWILKTDNANIYFSGDSGYGTHFKEIGDKYGPFDFAMMECGQYNEQWAQIHMSPEETIQAAIDLRSNLTMPIHWGVFKLALHNWDEPVIRASKKATTENIKFTTPKIGEPIILHSNKYTKEDWWSEIPMK